MPDVELQGTIVARDPGSPLEINPSPHEGLYLQTDDGRLLELVVNNMATQMAIDYMWRNSRGAFEAYLGQRVTLRGYLSRNTLYSAAIAGPLPDASDEPLFV
jgi:hypothetical protein